jgi:hypothetical protein
MKSIKVIKEFRQLAGSMRPDDLSALRSLRTTADLTVILADKGNATVVLNTTDYNEKISALLRASTYRRLASRFSLHHGAH